MPRKWAVRLLVCLIGILAVRHAYFAHADNKRLLGELKAHTCAVSSLAFTPDGRTLASGDSGILSDDGSSTVILWDMQTASQKHKITGLKGPIAGLAFSPDGKTLATASGDLRLWRWDSGKLWRKWAISTYQVAFSLDGKTLAGVCADKTLKMWDLKSGKLRRSFKVGGEGAILVAFSPDGKIVACGGLDRTIRNWDVQSGKPRSALPIDRLAVAIAFMSNGREVCAIDQSATFKIWNVLARKPVVVRRAKLQITNASFSLRGQFYVTATWASRGLNPDSHQGEITVWQTHSGEMQRQLFKHIPPMDSLAISPDGRVVAVGGSEGFNSIQLWRVD